MYLFPGEGGPRPHGCPIAAAPAPPVPPPAPLGGSGSPDADGFCILEAPPSPAPEGSPSLRWLAPGPLLLREGHFGPGGGSGGGRDRLRPPPGLPPPRERLLLRDVSLRWQLFGGRDFGAGHAPAARPRRGGHAPSGHAHWRTRGGPGRRQDLLMELHLSKVSVQHETYAEEAAEAQPWGSRGAGEGAAVGGGSSRGAAVGPGERPTARLVLLVQDLELRDRLGGGGGEPPLS
ncbi:autophagy-related protein 2 homolog A-like [Pezoporus occidentalis]|uniref:autophagy-related protein 2 homolog A-like n=1 Tax=Pezoporus occidentalis TaxID=407982 RepID=UPI002F9126A9